MHRNPAAFAVLVGGGIAGTLDAIYATTFASMRGMEPMKLWQLVASGWLGESAYQGGWSAATLGLVSHYGIMLCAAGLFYSVSRAMPFLVKRPIVSAMVFGVGMYVAMNFVILPLSAYPHPFRFIPWLVALNLLVHMFLVGVPIALSTRAARVAA